MEALDKNINRSSRKLSIKNVGSPAESLDKKYDSDEDEKEESIWEFSKYAETLPRPQKPTIKFFWFNISKLMARIEYDLDDYTEYGKVGSIWEFSKHGQMLPRSQKPTL